MTWTSGIGLTAVMNFRFHGGWIVALVLSVCSIAHAGVMVSPASISNEYKGPVTLTITGLDSAGQTVVVERYYDGDDSNSITAGDLLLQRFKVTDGQVTMLAGRRNLNVPGDEDSAANAAIVTKVIHSKDEITGRLDGRHIFRVSPDGAGFSPMTANLAVTQQDHGGSAISGRVMGSLVPQAGAIVLITSAGASDFDVVGITYSNALGNFSLKLPPGNYRPVAVKSGFVFDVGAAAVTPVSSGSVATGPDSLLEVAARTISGTVREDASPFNPLPAMIVYEQSVSGKFSLGFSDAAGNFVIPVAAEACELGVVEGPLALHGMMLQEGFADASPGDVTGFNLDMPRATALIYGRISTPADAPLPYAVVYGDSSGLAYTFSVAVTDADGNFTLGVKNGNWRVESEVPGFVISQVSVTVNSAESAVLQNLTADPVTSHLRGHAHDNLSNPLAYVKIIAQDFQGRSAFTTTDGNGNFDLGVFGGPGGTTKRWSIQLSQGSGASSAFVSTVVEFDVVDGVDINGIDYLAYAVTAHLRGHVLDENDAPASGFNVYASGQGHNGLNGDSVKPDGSFDIPVYAGNWQIGLSNETGSGVLPQDNLQVTVADGVDQNGLVFRVRHTTGTFSGSVKNSMGTGLAGINVWANVTVAGLLYQSVATTDSGGNYSLPVFSQTWEVGVDSSALINQGYQAVASQNVFINSSNVVVNFVASTGGQTFANWRSQKFNSTELADPNLSGPAADFEKDGISNLMEYALHLEPKISDAGGLPVPGRQPGWLTLTFTRLSGPTDLSYQVVEATTPAGPWTAIVAPLEVIGSNGTTDTVLARIPVDATARKFMRLKVVQSSP